MDRTTSWVAQHFRDRMTQKEIDEALVLAMEADKREIERLKAIVDSVSAVGLMRLQTENERLMAELAASQAREVKLREMFLLAVEFGAIPAFSLEELRKQFLALPDDDTALRAALAQRERETIERIAQRYESRPHEEFFGQELADEIRAMEGKP